MMIFQKPWLLLPGFLITLVLVLLFAPSATSPWAFVGTMPVLAQPPLWLLVIVSVAAYLLIVGLIWQRPHQDDDYGRPGGGRPDDIKPDIRLMLPGTTHLLGLALAPLAARRWRR